MPIQYYEKDFETFSMVWEQGYIATPKAKRDKDKHLLEKAACLLFRLKIKKNYFPSVPGASIYSGHPTLLTAVHITMN